MKFEYQIWSPTSDMTNGQIESAFNAYGEAGWAFISRDVVGRNVFMRVKSATSTATTVVNAPVPARAGTPRALNRPKK